VGKFLATWHRAISTATIAREFAPPRPASWPETLTHGQLAALQYPYNATETDKVRLAVKRADYILDCCKGGELPHTAETKNKMTSPAKTVDTGRHVTFLGAAAREVYTVPAEYKEVPTYTVTAPAFAAWLAAQGEVPSDHIAAWFEAVGVNHQSEAAPKPAPQPIVSSFSPTKKKRQDDLSPVIKDAQRDASDPFDTAAIWLRLCEWAQAKEKKFPLMGVDGKNIQWRIDSMDGPKVFTKKMLSDRLGKEKRALTTKAKTPLKRVK
jgi:hypothetical protein